MPSETSDAIEFSRSTDGDRIIEIWGVLLRATEELARSYDLAHTWWDLRIPGPISASDGKSQAVV